MKSGITIYLSLLFFVTSAQAQTPTVDEIIDGYFENIGGKEAWRQVKSMKIVGDGLQMGMNFPVVVQSKEPNLTKVTVDVQGMQIVEAYDGEIAWAINPFGGMTEATKKSEEETVEAAKETFQDDLLDYKDKGNMVTLEGTEEYEGTECYKLSLKRADGLERVYFFDSELFVPVAMRSFMKAGQMKGQTMDNVTSDYQEVDGLMVPFSMKQTVGGQTVMEMVIKSIEVNVPISDEEFTFPGN